jgi:hypothetical protein
MLNLILVELAVAALAGVAFVGVYVRSPWLRTPAGRHMMAVSLVMAAEAGTLLAVGAGVRVPLWAFAVGYGLIDVVVLHRLVLLWHARRTPPRT